MRLIFLSVLYNFPSWLGHYSAVGRPTSAFFFVCYHLCYGPSGSFSFSSPNTNIEKTMASNKPTLEEAAYFVQSLIHDERYADAEEFARAIKEKLPNEVNTLELNVLSLLDQALWGLGKPQSELDALKAEIVNVWQTKFRPIWEAQGRPKKLSSWARAWGKSANYKIVVNEYYIAESVGDISAYFKVLAFPKAAGAQQLPRVFKVETSAIVLELGSPKPYILREYFPAGGGGSTNYAFSEGQLNCKNILQAVIAFLDSNESHVAATIPARSPMVGAAPQPHNSTTSPSSTPR